MKLIRYADAVVVKTHGGIVRTLVDAITADRMAKTYLHDAKAKYNSSAKTRLTF